VNLNTNKAPGNDNICPFILKNCSLALLQHLAHLFHLSITNCHTLTEWKVHKLCPIHKGGSRSDITNYRPISLLNIVSKVLECIIYKKIIDFIQSHISNHQYGFLRNRSCLQQLLASYHHIYSRADNGLDSDVIYLDFSKAFDRIPHPELLHKLWHFGITGPLWSWFKSYLEGRTHFKLSK
jgi:hypothetical protein